jgi:ABC-2 type transport system permease protein
MLLRIRNLIGKELIQFRRDWLLTLFLMAAPALQLTLMAQAVEKGIISQPVVVLDLDQSRLSRQLVVNLGNTEELRVEYHVRDIEEVRQLLDGGEARLAVIIPAGLARELGAGQSQQIQIISDATNSMAASITMRAAGSAVDQLAADLALNRGLVVPTFIDFRTDVRFNPTLDVRAYSIPAQLGFIIYQVTLAVASLGLARERELGTLEQLMVTPLRRFELTMGKGLPALGIGVVNFGVMWAISLTLFQVPMNGSVPFLAIMTLVFISAEVGWGLVLSTFSRTQQQAILFVFIQAMIDITLSGFLVPVRNMPEMLQIISRLVPLQHYLVVIRGIMLKGAGLRDLAPHVLALVGLSLVMGLVALRRVAQRLE